MSTSSMIEDERQFAIAKINQAAEHLKKNGELIGSVKEIFGTDVEVLCMRDTIVPVYRKIDQPYIKIEGEIYPLPNNGCDYCDASEACSDCSLVAMASLIP